MSPLNNPGVGTTVELGELNVGPDVLIHSDSAGAANGIADVAAGQVLTSQGTTTTPAWAAPGAPAAHDLGGAEHSADTLANLNTKVSDATLIDTGDARLSDARTPTAHDLGGAEHSADTLANLNTKVSDATLIDTGDSRLSDARTPTAHALGGAEHSADTLANLNTKVSDATLIDTGDARLSDARTPTAHIASHQDGGTDELAVDTLAEADSPGNDVTQVLRPDGSGGVAFSILELSRGITIPSPGSSEDARIFFTNKAIEVTEMRAVLKGSSTPSATWTIRHDPDRSAAGNEVVTGGTITTSVTTGSDVTSFNDETIPANSFIWIETTAQSGTVTELGVEIFYK